jgi:Tetratricopeptide repeat
LHYESALKLHDEHDLARRESVLLNLASVYMRRGNHEKATKWLREAAKHAEVTRSGYYRCISLDQIAALACLLGERKRAARLFGAADAAHTETGLARELVDQHFLMPLLLQVKQALGAAAFDELYREGYALSAGQAIADARGWLEGPPDN